MAKRGERYCIVCGTKYEYCPNCGKGNVKDTWKFNYDSEECRDIFKVCSAFAFNHISAEEAKKKLSKYNLSDTSRFKEDIRINISAINAAKEKNAINENKTEIKVANEKAAKTTDKGNATVETDKTEDSAVVKDEPKKSYNAFGYSNKNKHNNTAFVNK